MSDLPDAEPTTTAEPASEPPNPLAPLGREEYIEQAHFFRTMAERLEANVPTQEVLQSVREEILATTKLPMAVDFLLAELRHEGVFGPAMTQLRHYFTLFQAFVIQEAEDDRSRFDLRIGLKILEREAEYRSQTPTPQGTFLYQFETLCRNRLGYDGGMAAIAADPGFDDVWRDWILTVRRQVGMVDIADLIYVHSAYYHRRPGPPVGRESASTNLQTPQGVVLFGEREGRIALANRHKDPLFLFGSLHRQLGYPEVPLPKRPADQDQILPQLARRLEQLETRVRLVEDEQQGGIDLTEFYERPEDAGGD